MTREQFDKHITVEKKFNGYVGEIRVQFCLGTEAQFDAYSREALQYAELAERTLRDCLWHELYGRRLTRYHELLDELLMCNPYSNPGKQREIIEQLHEVAPLEPVTEDVTTR